MTLQEKDVWYLLGSILKAIQLSHNEAFTLHQFKNNKKNCCAQSGRTL